MTVNSVEERILAAARYKLNMDEKVIQAGRFNNHSTGSERRELLQSILRADEEEEEENEAPDDEVVNQMIARSEDEFEMFQKMDIDRRRQEAEAGDKRKARLMDTTELPDFLLNEESEPEEEEEVILGRGNRSKKDTTYDDQLSEAQWLKAIGAEEEGYEDDDPDAPDSPEVPKKRGRGKKKREDDDDDEPRRKKKKGAMRRLQKKMRTLLEIVIKYEDQDDRILSEPFMKLPTKKELPDYYEVIRKPVDIKKILTKIDEEKVIY